GPAVAAVAADMSPGEPQYVPDVVHEQEPRFDLVAVLNTIDRDFDRLLHRLSLLYVSHRPACSRAGSRDAGGRRAHCSLGISAQGNLNGLAGNTPLSSAPEEAWHNRQGPHDCW